MLCVSVGFLFLRPLYLYFVYLVVSKLNVVDVLHIKTPAATRTAHEQTGVPSLISAKHIFLKNAFSNTRRRCACILCVCGGYHYYHRGQCVYFACEYSIRVPDDDVSDKTTHATVLFYVRPKHNLTLKGSLVRLNTYATHLLNKV